MTHSTPPLTLALDINGTLESAGSVLPGAIACVETLARDHTVLFATNTTTVSASSVADRLTALGFRCPVSSVFSAGTATEAYLRDQVRARPIRVLFLGEGSPFDGSAEVRLVDRPADAHVAVLGGCSSAMPLAWFERFAELAHTNNLPLVAMHANRYEARGGRICFDSGVLLSAVEHAAGVDAIVVGKPASDFFRSIARVAGADPGSIVFVGDDIDNDVLASQRAGMTGVLVRTGKYRRGSELRVNPPPNYVVDSLDEVVALVADIGSVQDESA